MLKIFSKITIKHIFKVCLKIILESVFNIFKIVLRMILENVSNIFKKIAIRFPFIPYFRLIS